MVFLMSFLVYFTYLGVPSLVIPFNLINSKPSTFRLPDD